MKVSGIFGERGPLHDPSSGNVMESIRGEACRGKQGPILGRRAMQQYRTSPLCVVFSMEVSMEVFQMIGRLIDGWTYREAKGRT